MRTLAWRLLEVGHCRQIERLTCVHAPWRPCGFPALVGLITHPDRGHILFDTGYSPAFFAATRRWPERAFRLATPVSLGPDESLAAQLAARGIADVRLIILSHFHADHICGVADFPGAAILCARAGWELMRGATRLAGTRRGLLPALLPDDFAARTAFVEEQTVVTLPAALAPFERGWDLIGDGSLVAVPLPGHAAGQLGVCFLADGGRPVFLIADAAWSMQAVRELAPPMWIASRLLHHTDDYPRTLRRLYELHRRNRDVLIVPSHCRERRQELVQ